MTKASEIIKQECCGVGLLNIQKHNLVRLVKRLEDENQTLKEDLSISNEFFSGQLRDLNGRNQKLRRECDSTFYLLVMFAFVIVFL